MNAGELNRRIVIKEKSITRLASGAESNSWTVKANTWAKVTQSKQQETVDHENFVLVDRLIFKIRYRNDLDTEMQIEYQGKNYEILTLTELGFRKGTMILTQNAE